MSRKKRKVIGFCVLVGILNLIPLVAMGVSTAGIEYLSNADLGTYLHAKTTNYSTINSSRTGVDYKHNSRNGARLMLNVYAACASYFSVWTSNNTQGVSLASYLGIQAKPWHPSRKQKMSSSVGGQASAAPTAAAPLTNNLSRSEAAKPASATLSTPSPDDSDDTADDSDGDDNSLPTVLPSDFQLRKDGMVGFMVRDEGWGRQCQNALTERDPACVKHLCPTVNIDLDLSKEMGDTDGIASVGLFQANPHGVGAEAFSTSPLLDEQGNSLVHWSPTKIAQDRQDRIAAEHQEQLQNLENGYVSCSRSPADFDSANSLLDQWHQIDGGLSDADYLAKKKELKRKVIAGYLKQAQACRLSGLSDLRGNVSDFTSALDSDAADYEDLTDQAVQVYRQIALCYENQDDPDMAAFNDAAATLKDAQALVADAGRDQPTLRKDKKTLVEDLKNVLKSKTLFACTQENGPNDQVCQSAYKELMKDYEKDLNQEQKLMTKDCSGFRPDMAACSNDYSAYQQLQNSDQSTLQAIQNASMTSAMQRARAQQANPNPSYPSNSGMPNPYGMPNGSIYPSSGMRPAVCYVGGCI